MGSETTARGVEELGQVGQASLVFSLRVLVVRECWHENRSFSTMHLMQNGVKLSYLHEKMNNIRLGEECKQVDLGHC